MTPIEMKPAAKVTDPRMEINAISDILVMVAMSWSSLRANELSLYSLRTKVKANTWDSINMIRIQKEAARAAPEKDSTRWSINMTMVEYQSTTKQMEPTAARVNRFDNWSSEWWNTNFILRKSMVSNPIQW